MNEKMYSFEVDEGMGWYCVGGWEDTPNGAIQNKANYFFHRDKRKKPPLTRMAVRTLTITYENFNE